jgi:inosine-uridine nucleoside N-ribohydrolase
MTHHEAAPTLVLTDIGRDVDDVEALAYLAGHPRTEIAAVATTHMIPDRRAMIARAVLTYLGSPNMPIGVGSVYPWGQEDPRLDTYLQEHAIGGKTYEGGGLIACFPNAADLINETIDAHADRLQVAALAPVTDLAHAADKEPALFGRIGRLFVQGQALVDDKGRLHPDPEAYNLAEDMEAAERIFAYQDTVPMTFVGKHAAYQLPLLRTDFDTFVDTGNPLGAYLKNHAEQGIKCFAERAPEVFGRVFGVEPAQIDTLQELSKPYDALVAVAIAEPARLQAQHIGHHTLVGVSAEQPGVEAHAAPELKSHLVQTIVDSLKRLY